MTDLTNKHQGTRPMLFMHTVSSAAARKTPTKLPPVLSYLTAGLTHWNGHSLSHQHHRLLRHQHYLLLCTCHALLSLGFRLAELAVNTPQHMQPVLKSCHLLLHIQSICGMPLHMLAYCAQRCFDNFALPALLSSTYLLNLLMRRQQHMKPKEFGQTRNVSPPHSGELQV